MVHLPVLSSEAIPSSSLADEVFSNLEPSEIEVLKKGDTENKLKEICGAMQKVFREKIYGKTVGESDLSFSQKLVREVFLSDGLGDDIDSFFTDNKLKNSIVFGRILSVLNFAADKYVFSLLSSINPK